MTTRSRKAHWHYLLDKRDSAIAASDAASLDAQHALSVLLASGNACRVLREAHANNLIARAIKLQIDLIFIKAVMENESLLQLAEEGPDV